MPSSRLKRNEPCVVCALPTTEFNYGVISCNKCKMIFRRALEAKSPLESCKSDQICTECRKCRFYSCVRSGMQIKIFTNNSDIQKLSKQLLWFDSERKYKFFHFQMTEDLGLNQVLNSGSVTLSKKEKNVIFTSHDWVLMEIYTTIEFMKRLDPVNLLSSSDLKCLIKHSYFKCAIFFIAVRSYSEKLEFMTFPSQVDVFPEEISQVPDYSPHLLNRIRCLLISKFIELRVTKEELLLLISVIFCDSSASDLSQTAINIISQYRRMYSYVLFRYCSTTYQQYGPTRFTNLVFLSQVLTSTIMDLDNAVTLFHIHQPTLPLRKLVKESF